MRHVFGMAKSIVTVKSGQQRALDENLLKLERAVRTIEDDGETAHGYLLVLGDDAEKRLSGWVRQRELEASITILKPRLTPSQEKGLQEEKERMRARRTPSDSIASFGGPLAEELLAKVVRKLEPGIKGKAATVLGTKWDFYGVRED